MVADIATAFVLLVAGGCARAVAQPLWRRFVHWWHTEGNEPAEFRFMDRLVELMAAKPKYEPLVSDWFCSQYTGTKNAGKLPILSNCAEREEFRTVLLAEKAEVAKAAENMRKAERRVDASEAGGLMESIGDVRISKGKLEGLEKVADRARLVLEIYRYHGEAYATPQSLELLRRAVEELEERRGE